MYNDYSYSEPPLNKPLYNATMKQAVVRWFKKMFNFKGYASRSEYWWVALFIFLVMIVPSGLSNIGSSSDASMMAALIGGIFSIIYGILSLFMFISTLGLTWRRLHDAGFSGAWFFISLIPIIGWIIFLILTILPTNPAKHQPEWEDNII